MTDLVEAYQRDDIHKYESILQSNQDVLADPFIAENIDEVTRNMRTKAVLKLIAPYTRFTLECIATKLNIAQSEVQDILGYLIVDKKVRGKIDQQKGIVEIEANSDIDRMQSMMEWSTAIGSLWETLFAEGEGFRTDDTDMMASRGGFSDGPGLFMTKSPFGAASRSKPGFKFKGASGKTTSSDDSQLGRSKSGISK